MTDKKPIGVFDSGYGGLTILKELTALLPQYDYLYLGDNARAPYGSRSFETVYQYTLECVKWLFDQNCSLVIVACNTASAKALRTIQQKDLPRINMRKRVLGVIRPTAEVIGSYTQSKSIGIMGTRGTVESESYLLEINKFFPEVTIHQQACPMWVPMIENNEYNNPGADYFIKKDINDLLSQSASIDTILLACTHYPLLMDKIQQFVPKGVKVIAQGEIVANALKQYFQKHIEIDEHCSKGGEITLCTTDNTADFDEHTSAFFGKDILSRHIQM